jgi:hypothetical protein
VQSDRRGDGSSYAVTAADSGHALLAVVQAASNGVMATVLSVRMAVVS